MKGYGREGKGYGREGKERKERAEREGRRERRGEEREQRGGERGEGRRKKVRRTQASIDARTTSTTSATCVGFNRRFVLPPSSVLRSLFVTTVTVIGNRE